MTFQVHTYDPIEGWNWQGRETFTSLKIAIKLYRQTIKDDVDDKCVVIFNKKLLVIRLHGKLPRSAMR